MNTPENDPLKNILGKASEVSAPSSLVSNVLQSWKEEQTAVHTPIKPIRPLVSWKILVAIAAAFVGIIALASQLNGSGTGMERLAPVVETIQEGSSVFKAIDTYTAFSMALLVVFLFAATRIQPLFTKAIHTP